MDSVPLWGIFLASVAFVVIPHEIGFYLARWDYKRLTRGESISTGLMVGASLSLAAFMLAFTFGSVTSRLDERRHLVLDEANAIGTAYLRSDLLPHDSRQEIRRILNDYVTLRLDLAEEISVQKATVQKIVQSIDRSKELQDELWSRAVAVADENPTPVIALFLDSVNELIDLHEKRVTVTVYHRLSTIFWILMYGLLSFTMLVGGHEVGLKGKRHSVKNVLVVAIVFSLVLVLVVALDRPKQNLAPVTHDALIDLQDDIRRSMESHQ